MGSPLSDHREHSILKGVKGSVTSCSDRHNIRTVQEVHRSIESMNSFLNFRFPRKFDRFEGENRTPDTFLIYIASYSALINYGNSIF